jgi:hypothetical protein
MTTEIGRSTQLKALPVKPELNKKRWTGEFKNCRKLDEELHDRGVPSS